ncbi:hypothetical protein, partial [Gluconacetobacter entanii]|uniref:hypothetical protein n=1 Tax=Gluconacetobacter entanii TaxID=108528 RepID=UPI0011B84DC7
GNTSPCHHSLHLFAKTDESQQAGIVQKLSDRALRQHSVDGRNAIITFPQAMTLIDAHSSVF